MSLYHTLWDRQRKYEVSPSVNKFETSEEYKFRQCAHNHSTFPIFCLGKPTLHRQNLFLIINFTPSASCMCLPRYSPSLPFFYQNIYAFLILKIRSICSIHFLRFDQISLTTSGKERRPQTSYSSNFLGTSSTLRFSTNTSFPFTLQAIINIPGGF